MTFALILAAVQAHAGAILAVAYALLNLLNAALPGAEAQSILAKVADVLAFLTRAEAGGTLKMPGSASRAPDAPPAAGGSLKAVALLLAPLLFLNACATCKLPANAAVPSCVLEANMVSCGESDGFALLPVVLGLIASAVAGQPFDAAALESQLEAQGVKDVPCVLAALEDYISSSAEAKAGDPVSAYVAAEAHAALVDELRKKGGHGHVTIKLRTGHIVELDLP